MMVIVIIAIESFINALTAYDGIVIALGFDAEMTHDLFLMPKTVHRFGLKD